MTIDTDRRPGPEAAFDGAERAALAALALWRRSVRSLSHLAGGDRQSALLGLATWYEHVCADGRFDDPPPMEGFEALYQVEDELPPRLRELIVSRWAVRVADELARCRRLRAMGPDCADAWTEALAGLELARQGAERHLAGNHHLSQGQRT